LQNLFSGINEKWARWNDGYGAVTGAYIVCSYLQSKRWWQKLGAYDGFAPGLNRKFDVNKAWKCAPNSLRTAYLDVLTKSCRMITNNLSPPHHISTPPSRSRQSSNPFPNSFPSWWNYSYRIRRRRIGRPVVRSRLGSGSHGHRGGGGSGRCWVHSVFLPPGSIVVWAFSPSGCAPRAGRG